MAEESKEGLPETTKSVTKFSAEHAKELGLPSPEAFNYMTAVVNQLKGSALVPQMERDASPQQATANMLGVIMTGREMGLQPMESLRSMGVLKGKIWFHYDLMIRIMVQRGIKLEWVKDDEEGATIRGTREDGYSYTSFFGPQDAERAGLVKPDSNYRKYPRNMYRARAVSNLFRILGVGPQIYTPEEAIDIEPEEVTPEALSQSSGSDIEIDEETIPTDLQQSVVSTYREFGMSTGEAWRFLEKVSNEAEDARQAKQMIAQQTQKFVDGVYEKKKKGGRKKKPTATEQAKKTEEKPPPKEDLGVSDKDVPKAESSNPLESLF